MVKLKIILICFLCLSTIITAQNVGINTTGATPSSSAILDIVSTDQGILIPRMTDAQRQALKDPATGLMIYNTSTNQVNVYNGSNWQLIPSNSVSATSAGGTGPGGGIAINATGASPHASAILDVSSTEKGVIVPKTTQGSISSPTSGLIIYNTSTNQINYYNGSTWQTLCPTTIDNNKGTSATANVGVGINASGTAPDISAALDVTSTTKGLLIPRMTAAQRDAIKTPAQGLMVYNTTSSRLENWTSSAWHELIYYVPSTPGVITGNTTFCPSVTGQTFSISAVTGATSYTWTVPSGASVTSGQGTTNVTVSFGTSSGNVSVTASNGCGTSAARTLAVTVYSAPSISASPTSTNVCSGGNADFSVTSSGTSLSYQWQYSNGGAYGNVSNGTPTGASYSNQTTANMTVSGITASGSSHFYRCVITGTCSLSTNSSAATLTITTAPTTANAGTDQGVCTNTATLAGNTPGSGSGTWTLIAGSGSITTPSSPTSGITGLGSGTNTFRWTVTNAPCPASTDDVNINIGGSVTSNCGGATTMTDTRDSKVYNIVEIGTQCWMAQNLNYGTYVDHATHSGPQAPGDKFCSSLYVWSPTLSDPSCPYGGLYDYANMMNGASRCNGLENCPACVTPIQGLCPSGWHVPSHYEWTLLENTVNTSPTPYPYDETTTGDPGGDAGYQLTDATTGYWCCGWAGSDAYGFAAYGGGEGYTGASLGGFTNQLTTALFWSTSTANLNYVWRRKFIVNQAVSDRYWSGDLSNTCYSIRCVKD